MSESITVTAQRPVAPTNAAPQCFVEIYPFEGGMYSITGGSIIECTVDKVINTDDPGTFSILLAPSGPKGPNISPLWNEIVTPSSLCLIGMTRGNYQTIVMIGIVRTATVVEKWDNQVKKGIVIAGEDFFYFFNQMPWASLTYLALPAVAAAAAGLSVDAAGSVATLSSSYVAAEPGEFAQRYYQNIMAGSSTVGGQSVTLGALTNTQFKTKSGSVTFPKALGYLFEKYPGYKIPFGGFFMNSGGPWTEQFREALQWPWYEFFVITSDQAEAALNYPGVTQPAQAFTMQALGPDIKVSPYIVGRVNPLPKITVNASGRDVTFGAIDVSKWNALKGYKADGGYIESNLVFDDSEVRNFYFVNPSYFKMLLGDSNSSPFSFMFQFGGAIDPASIHRYGFRPEYKDTNWFNDATGTFAQQGQPGSANFQQLVAQLTAVITSYHEPTPIMARAAVTYPLRPDIIAGNRFTYNPFKGGPTWDFYVLGVKHVFRFGGRSMTTLSLTRGLPSSVYSDASQGGILAQAHLGNAQRINGVYQTGVPAGLGPTLSAVNATTIPGLSAQLSNTATTYTTPQGGKGG